MRALLRWIGAHRRRLAPLVLVAAVVVLGIQASNAAPRQTNVRVRLHDPQTIREVTLTYEATTDGNSTLARWAFPEGGPERLNDTRSLVPGDYDLHIDVLRAEGAQSSRRTISQRRLTVPSDGTVIVDLVGEEPE